MSTRAVIYGRVTTKDQSVDMQVSELRRFAQARGWQVETEFTDQASGATVSRPAFDEAMRMLRQRKADVLLCWKFDRVGRSTTHLLGILEELRALGVGFCSMTEGIDTTTPAGKMVFTFLAAIAEFERGLIRERVQAGIENARERGVRFGRPRAGFNVARAAEMRRQGHSIRAIARSEGVGAATVFRALQSVQAVFQNPGTEGCQKTVSEVRSHARSER